MKHYYLVILLSIALTSIDAKAQTGIKSLEYWFDDYSNVVSQNIIPEASYTFNEALSTSSLDYGLHQFTIRFKDANEQWSAPVSQFFYKKTAATTNAELVNYEYWLDGDIANAVSSAISSGSSFTLNQSFDLSSLNNGLHQFSIRFKDSKGYWSSPVSHFVHKAVHLSNNQIEAYQYWINDNIAEAVNVVFSSQNTITILDDLDFTDLKAGTHQLNIRFKDSNGKWSSTISEEFLKVASSLDDHLIAHYPLDGHANDESGEEHHGTIYGATSAPDRNGNTNSAFQFDGQDDYIDLGDWINGGATTITFWARWDAFHNYSRIVDLGNGSSSDNIIVSNYQQGGRLFWQVYSTSTQSLTSTDNILTPNRWDFYAVTVDEAGLFKMYQNAILVAENTGVVPRQLNRTEQFIGKSNFSQDGYFQGLIDDVRIYNKALDEAEVATVNNSVPTNNGSIIPINNTKVYPIPANDELTVELNNSEISIISIFDSKGRMIKRYNNVKGKYQLNVSNLQKGVYYLHITSGSGTSTQKIIKD
jgi:hypothetical protein